MEFEEEYENIETSWIDDFENIDALYNDFYTEEIDSLSMHYLYVNKKSELFHIEKDIIDICLIKNFLEPRLNNYLTLKIREFIFYRILRLRNLMIHILIKFKFYLILKKLFKLIFKDKFN